jgi:DJ-1 family protein
MKKKACVVAAEGSEEMEAVISVDVLRRAGIEVYLAGVGDDAELLRGSRGLRFAPDGPWNPAEADRFDALVVPGGMSGVVELRQDASVADAARRFWLDGKIVASICAGPLVLLDAGVLDGRRFTSHPSVRDELPVGTWVDDVMVRDGNLLTSQGPGTCFEFALELASMLASPETARVVAAGMMLRR